MKNVPALYTLADEYLQAAERLAELDLPEEVVKDTLEGLAGDLELKSTNVAMFIRNLEESEEAIRAAAADMIARADSIGKRADRVREYLKEQMERTGITKIECPYFTLAIQKNPPSVRVVNEGAVPIIFMRIPPVPAPTPDKQLIKKTLLEGTDVPGCELQHGTTLRIK
jgi:hypothetical protein